MALHECVIYTVFSWTLIIYKTFLIKSCYLKMLLNNMYTITMFSISRYYKIVIPCSKLYSLQTSITLSIREVSTPCYKTATEWEFQVIKLYLIGRGFSGPGVAIKRPCFNFFHSLPHLSLYWSTKTKISEKTFSCKSKIEKKISKRNTIKRANNLNKQYCRTNAINDISTYDNPIELLR